MKNKTQNTLFLCLIAISIFTCNGSAQKINSIAISGTNIYLGSSTGLYKVTNNGNTWVKMKTGAVNYKHEVLDDARLDLVAASGSTVIARGDNTRMFASTNNGDSWKELTSKNKLYDPMCGLIYNNEIALGYSKKVFFTKDISKIAEDGWEESKEIKSKDLQSDYKMYAIDRKGPLLIVGGGSFTGFRPLLHLSENGGKNWEEIKSVFRGNYVTAILINGSDIFVGTRESYKGIGGIYCSQDRGNTWQLLKEANVISFVLVGTTLFSATSEGILSSSDNGKTWIKRNTGFDAVEKYEGAFQKEYLLVECEKTLYAVSNAVLYRSTDNGASWIKAGGKKAKEAMDSIQTIEDRIKSKARAIITNYFCGNAEVEYANFDAAIQKYTAALDARPNFTEALSARKDCYTKMKQLDKANADAEQLAKIKKDNSTEQEKFNIEFKALESVIMYGSGDAHFHCYYKDDKGWFGLGCSKLSTYTNAKGYERKETMLDDAIKYFNKAIELNNKVAEYYIRRGEAYTLNKEFDKRNADFDNAKRIDPSNKCAVACYNASLFECDKCKGTGKEWFGEGGREKVVYVQKNLAESSNSSSSVLVQHKVAGYKPCTKCEGKGKVQR